MLNQGVALGVLAGWTLTFMRGRPGTPAIATIESLDHHATIEAALPDGIAPGHYTFAIEGVSDDVCRTLYACAASAPLVASIALFWRDASPLGGQSAAPVATVRVTALRRRAGRRRYELLVEAREWVYDRLLAAIPEGAGSTAASPLGAIKKVASALHVTSTSTPDPGADSAGEGAWVVAAGESGTELLRSFEGALVEESGQYGLGMFHIRDGALYAGPGRIDRDARTLDDDTGLLDVQEAGSVLEDPSENPGPDRLPARRLRYRIALRGRPDLKPGHTVRFTPTSSGVDALGTPLDFELGVSFGADAPSRVTATVLTVTHHVSRERGFTSELECLAAAKDGDPWIRRDAQKAVARLIASERVGPGRGVEGVAKFLRELKARLDALSLPEVAEVRAHVSQKMSDLEVQQTERLRLGLSSGKGEPRAATLVPARDKGEVTAAVPYLSPFAWGAYGLVLPRYPGMRVAVLHRLGDRNDLIDLGALWDHGTAPSSEPGDYWLTLPAGLSPDLRQHVDDDKRPLRHPKDGKASNDLVDADGRRVIQVGQLTVRVGQDHLLDAGTRPTAPQASAAVTIEHDSGARITIDDQGAIVIHAKTSLTLAADDNIVLDTPKQVLVQVGQFMDVRGR